MPPEDVSHREIMAFSLFLPVTPTATTRVFASSHATLQDAITAAAAAPGAIVEVPVVGGSSIVWEIPQDPEVAEREAVAAAEALLPDGYEIVPI